MTSPEEIYVEFVKQLAREIKGTLNKKCEKNADAIIEKIKDAVRDFNCDVELDLIDGGRIYVSIITPYRKKWIKVLEKREEIIEEIDKWKTKALKAMAKGTEVPEFDVDRAEEELRRIADEAD